MASIGLIRFSRFLMKGFLAQKFYGLLVVRNRLNTTTSFRRNEFEEEWRKFAGNKRWYYSDFSSNQLRTCVCIYICTHAYDCTVITARRL